MPKLSEFFGIEIRMYWYDHLPPHFHAIYGSEDASVNLETLEILYGVLPPRAARFVREWSMQHTAELWADWRRAQQGEPLLPIPPLD